MTDTIRAELLEILGDTALVPERFERLVAYVRKWEQRSFLDRVVSRAIVEGFPAEEWREIQAMLSPLAAVGGNGEAPE